MTGFSFGPMLDEQGVTFRLWAPKEVSVSLRSQGTDTPMTTAEGGWFELCVAGAGQGTRYSFVLGNGTAVPDPASRSQPDDVHGPSEVVGAEAYPWSNPDWVGRPWNEMVVYELHTGTFTEEGTFLAAIERLDHLCDLGVTAIQLMPVNQFRGRRGWGYDGVLPYAPDESYGRPEHLKDLIDAAHRRGISVFLDVVYNHFGPDGNYMPSYAPLFTDKHASSWGAGINYDDEGSAEVRKFIVENVVYWVDEFRVDGLRFDAVHAIKDDSDEHLLKAIARNARAAAGRRHLHLVVENEDNASSLLERDERGRAFLFTAQWNDDIHHVLHATASGEDFGYYADFAHDDAKLAKALAEGFVFQGEEMAYRGAPRGEPSSHLPPTAFISFIQNHDQIGNRAFGDRLSHTATPEAMQAIAGVYLLSPQIPMIFMGEEWGATTPFPYFCDFDDQLNAVVRQGRREELSKLPGFSEKCAESTPDPADIQTFLSAKLDWNELSSSESSERFELYRNLIQIRQRELVPYLGDCKAVGSSSDDVLRVTWTLGAERRLQLVANLSPSSKPFDGMLTGQILWCTGGSTNTRIDPWTVYWTADE
ncbi:malto-oligosyltrehalose trehalohydrolase [Rhizobium sp. Root1220]|uniref:malto-oligosyltrehalose trehalohydrolase n=1 Tax=Rhizobium sp. Root1220 TaxID=1736432 RepID=UPI0006F29602|nr:malto-oligosyltrehalose trehalohydrolase [Rhizobium sp. Root1220]KQV65139.1 malto-oligosyltrehalose trehalohydrolase [Rhizobium sp. Root1220]